YEVLTGTHPFAGRLTLQALMAAHLSEPPPSLRAVRSDIDPALADLVHRCLAKQADDRPRDAGEVLALLDAVSAAHTSGASAPLPGFRRRFVVGGVAAVAAIALAMAVLRSGRATSSLSGPESSADSLQSIAVLPFL